MEENVKVKMSYIGKLENFSRTYKKLSYSPIIKICFEVEHQFRWYQIKFTSREKVQQLHVLPIRN